MSNDGGLPQLRGGLYLSDGGLEATLVFRRGIQLPQAAAFALLGDERGRDLLMEYYKPYLQIAARTPGAGFVLETPTRKAHADWGARLGFDAAALDAANRDAAALVRQLRQTWTPRIEREIVTAGIIGPRGDGAGAGAPAGVDEAASYHQAQAESLRSGGVDMLVGVTMTSSIEARGVARAAAAAGLPCAISFTVETDGRLPSGEALGSAIEAVDADGSNGGGGSRPAYFQLDGAHPSHLDAALAQGGSWRERIRGLRANASAKSRAELEAATELDDGDPQDLAERCVRLRALLPNLNVLGGGWGTDDRHLKAIAKAWLAAS